MRAALLACLVLPLLCGPARAQKSSDTLRIAWRDAIVDADPYHNSQRTGLVLAQQAWDTLVYRDPETLQLRPLLALSWRQLDDTTIEFTLRPNVHFHDGSAFTAADVAYTINDVIADPAVAVAGNYAYLAGAERIDDLHVRVHLKGVFPAALDYLAMTLPILPQAYRQRVGVAAYAAAPVGTGPYRIVRIDGTREIDLDRNDGYFDGPKGRPMIGHLAIHEVANTTSEITELLSGRADWIWMFGTDQSDAIDRDPDVVTLRTESMRVAFLSMDAAGRTGAGNPLTVLKVRQAIAHAIDRQAIVRQSAGGAARVLDAPCYPTQFGCDQAAAVHYDYDPQAARTLLAQAGYPDGFSTELVTTALPGIAAALQAALEQVGIHAHLTPLPIADATRRSNDGTAPLLASSWGSYSVNDVSAFLPNFFAGGPGDYARDPEVERLVQEGGTTTDPDQRRSAYSAAIRRITAQAYWLPLSTSTTTYAFARQLNFRAYADELPRFYAASWR